MPGKGKTMLKKLLIGFILSIGSTSFATESDNFVSCYGAHHGWYVDVFAVTGSVSSDMVEMNIVISDDSDETPYRIFSTVKVEKFSKELEVKAYRWAFKEALRKGLEYGYIKITAKELATNSTMYINLNIFGDKIENAISIDGDIQSLTCNLKN